MKPARFRPHPSAEAFATTALRYACALVVPALLALAPLSTSAQTQLAHSGDRADDARATPEMVRTPSTEQGRRILSQADTHRGMKVLVSIDQRRLWLVERGDTLMNSAVAIGMGESFEHDGKQFFFETPRGKRTVRGKQANPIWTPPEWHYLERAKAQDLEIVRLKREDKVELSGGYFLLTIGDDVGRLNPAGYFWPITPGNEIIFDGKVFVPPIGTRQRSVPDALGPYKLDTGDGYLIHGTHIYNEDSIGEAVSHGCVRMTNEELATLYALVPVGTPVFIF